MGALCSSPFRTTSAARPLFIWNGLSNLVPEPGVVDQSLQDEPISAHATGTLRQAAALRAHVFARSRVKG